MEDHIQSTIFEDHFEDFHHLQCDVALEVVEVKKEPEDWQVESQDLNETITKIKEIKQEYKCIWCHGSLYKNLQNLLSPNNINSCKLIKSQDNLCSICQKIFKFPIVPLTDVKTRLSCKLCNKFFVTLAKLDEHLQNNCSDKRNKTIKQNRLRRLMKESKEIFECDICLATFTNQGNLTQHNQKIHKIEIKFEKQFPCKVCGKKFNYRANAYRHMLEIHFIGQRNKERMKSCDICGKKFARKDLLNQHIMNHTGLRPFKCEICDMKFKNKNALEVHVLLHTGEKPFACDICDKRFNRKGNMLEHREGHDAKYEKCPRCLNYFKKGRSIDQHTKRNNCPIPGGITTKKELSIDSRTTGANAQCLEE